MHLKYSHVLFTLSTAWKQVVGHTIIYQVTPPSNHPLPSCTSYCTTLDEHTKVLCHVISSVQPFVSALMIAPGHSVC